LSSNSIRVGGFKHALVSIVAGCVAQRGRLHLRNVPSIRETEILSRLLTSIGAYVDRCCSDELRIDCSTIDRCDVDAGLSAEIHGSLYLIPSLLVAMGRVRFETAGGCLIGDSANLGARPTHHILSVLKMFGATFRVENALLIGEVDALQHCEIDIMDYSDKRDLLTGPLVSGATKTAVIASLGASKLTTIRNPYWKPDVVELVKCISNAGHGTEWKSNSLEIAGRAFPPERRWSEHCLISDLSEIITFIAFSVMSGVSVGIEGLAVDAVRQGIAPELDLLERMEVPIVWLENGLRIDPPRVVRSVDIDVTSVGIYSDHQPFFALMLMRGSRPAYIREHVWKSRFDYARELKKLGAIISIRDGEILIYPSHLRPTHETLVARDLRAAAALLIAGVSTRGHFQLSGAEHLERGYSNLIQNLSAFGAQLQQRDI
jgi:UDP-N-acetylglucosamine 1-carboxyvinyltransferase